MRAALALLALALATRADADLFSTLRKTKNVVGTAAKLGARIDEEQERSIGRAVAANLVARYGLVDDPEAERYLTTLGSWLASQSSRPEIPYRFAILDTDEVNAFAAPGGYVLVSRGALALTEDESELAGLLAHEIVHVSERHGVRSIEDSYRKKVILSGVAKAAGRKAGVNSALVSAFGELTDELTDVLLTKGLSRKLELEADREAMTLVTAAGYDPGGLARILDRMGARAVPGERMKTLARTHPPPEARAEALRAAMTEDGIAEDASARWPELHGRAIAGLAGSPRLEVAAIPDAADLEAGGRDAKTGRPFRRRAPRSPHAPSTRY